jgi:tetratricopeptide (TPR) repeat protein
MLILKKSILALIISILFFSLALAEERPLSATMQKGIGQFKHENYDEALITFQQARKEESRSTIAAYYLGLTYKKIQNYKDAVKPLKDAVTQEPKIAGALLELIDCLYQLDELSEAKRWIAEAEKENVRPAQTAFMKGLVYLKDDQDDEAISAFKKAKELDPSMQQSCDYQLGIAYIKKKQLVDAKKIFKDTIVYNPASTMGGLARQYLDALQRKEEAEKPWKFNFNVGWQYDDNVTLKPDDSTITTSVSGKSDSREVYLASAEYNHSFNDTFSIRGLLQSYYSDQNKLNFYDMFNENIVIQPNVNLKNSFLSFPFNYNYIIVDKRAYLSSWSSSSIYNRMFGSVNMGQASFTYQRKDYRWSPSTDDEDRSGNNYATSLGWFYFFAKNKGYINARYTFNKEETNGNNWDYYGNRGTLVALIPMFTKFNLTLSADAFSERFLNNNTSYNNTKRKDTVYTFAAVLAYKILKDSEFQIQYTHVKDNCNIEVYQYDRNIYGAGFNFRF